MLDIKITRTTCPKEKPQDESKLGFGKKFTDHMFVMDYTEGEGWHDARIVPYAPFQLDPATVVFHYAQEIFEGMKAYRTADDTIQLFRPECNAKRMQDSADRLCIPKIPVEDYIQAVEALVDVDRDWVPHSDGASLYIRPFVFANDVGLGVHASKHYIFCIICAPSGAYYAEGINPVRIYVEDEYIRAAPGLTGFTKCGGNYAASIKAGELAEEQGYAQVLWLDGVEKKYVEEVGSMNIMFKIKGKVVTPALLGTVLPGITRKSVIEMLKSWGVEVEERLVTLEEILEGIKNGDKRCLLAASILAYQIKKYIGSYAAAMDGLDAVVFTAGMGENNPELRDRVCRDMSFFGIEIDYELNAKTWRQPNIVELSTPASKVKVYVIPTNEELMIAKDTEELVKKAK